MLFWCLSLQTFQNVCILDLRSSGTLAFFPMILLVILHGTATVERSYDSTPFRAKCFLGISCGFNRSSDCLEIDL